MEWQSPEKEGANSKGLEWKLGNDVSIRVFCLLYVVRKGSKGW
jgi:hypothetical protein